MLGSPPAARLIRPWAGVGVHAYGSVPARTGAGATCSYAPTIIVAACKHASVSASMLALSVVSSL